MFAADLRWPPGLYASETPILHLPQELLRIVGRDRAKLTGSQAATTRDGIERFDSLNG